MYNSFFSKMWPWYQQKQPNFEIWVRNSLKYPLVSIVTKLENAATKHFFAINRPRIATQQ